MKKNLTKKLLKVVKLIVICFCIESCQNTIVERKEITPAITIAGNSFNFFSDKDSIIDSIQLVKSNLTYHDSYSELNNVIKYSFNSNFSVSTVSNNIFFSENKLKGIVLDFYFKNKIEFDTIIRKKIVADIFNYNFKKNNLIIDTSTFSNNLKLVYRLKIFDNELFHRIGKQY